MVKVKRLFMVMPVIVALLFVMALPAFADSTVPAYPTPVPALGSHYFMFYDTQIGYWILANSSSSFSLYNSSDVQGTDVTYYHVVSGAWTSGNFSSGLGNVLVGNFSNVTSYYSSDALSYSGTTFFKKAPLVVPVKAPWGAIQAGALLQPVQVLLVVLGGCLILLILSMSFRNGWKFLLTALRGH